MIPNPEKESGIDLFNIFVKNTLALRSRIRRTFRKSGGG